jgi:hypothetical protein
MIPDHQLLPKTPNFPQASKERLKKRKKVLSSVMFHKRRPNVPRQAMCLQPQRNNLNNLAPCSHQLTSLKTLKKSKRHRFHQALPLKIRRLHCHQVLRTIRELHCHLE